MTRVVKPDELGRPDESLRELMRRLELSPQEGENTLTHYYCQLHGKRYDYMPSVSLPPHRDWRWTPEPVYCQ